jgi:hypothetical protein
MQVQDFVKVYQAKTDEELMQLAEAQEQLTSEARLALQGELTRRRIRFAENFSTSQNRGHWLGAGHVIPAERLQESARQTVGDFVEEVLRAYHRHFWLFFKITAPAVIIGTIAFITGRDEAREIYRHLPRGLNCWRTEPRSLNFCLSDGPHMLSAGWHFRFRLVLSALPLKKSQPDIVHRRAFFLKCPRTARPFPAFVSGAVRSDAGGTRRFFGAGGWCVMGIASMANILVSFSNYGDVMGSYGIGPLGFVTARASRTSCYFGRL